MSTQDPGETFTFVPADNLRCERYYQVKADSPFAAVRAVNDPGIFEPGCVKVKKAAARPNYGGNPLRWLFGRPKFYDVTVTFEIEADPLDRAPALPHPRTPQPT